MAKAGSLRELAVDTQLVIEKVKAAGFQYVAIDLQGYRTGSLNEVILMPGKRS